MVSFYTENTPYQLEAYSLIASCQIHGIELEIEALSSLGSWEKNCAQKPRFIRDRLIDKQRSIFWVDADAVFHKTPNFSPFLPFDLAVYDVPGRREDRFFRYRAGSIFLNYTQEAIRFANEWVSYCEKVIDKGGDLSFLDQTSLFDLLQGPSDLKFTPLPLAYCKVFDSDASLIAQTEVVIEHFQASCRLKHLV